VLCSGAIGTPHLLQRSGVGPAEHLSAHGVRVRHALSGVGQGLVDHPLCPVVFNCDQPVSLMAAESPLQLARYLFARRGMLSSNVAEATLFLRTHRALDGPDLELMFVPVAWTGQGRQAPARHGFSIGAIALTPRSRGQVALSSSDPDRAPAIRPGYLSDPADVRVLSHGLRLARRLAAHPALQAFGTVTEQAPTAGAGDGEEVADALRDVAQTLYHPAGTCRMGADSLAVVDPTLRVHGLAGLCVADASVMPTLPRAHPQSAVHLVAERAASLLIDGPVRSIPFAVQLDATRRTSFAALPALPGPPGSGLGRSPSS
jgi:choline dehydrogenase